MSKKMSAKEFKQVITDVYGDFECWGFEGMLNLIAIAESHLANEDRERGYLLIAGNPIGDVKRLPIF